MIGTGNKINRRFSSIVLLLFIFNFYVHAQSSEQNQKLIKDMSIEEIVKVSNHIWVRSGLNPVSMRLLYRALSVDFNNPKALQSLADLFVEDAMIPAAIVYSYMQTDAVELSIEDVEKFDTMFASAMWLWGLSKRKDGSQQTQLQDFYNKDLFIYDMDEYHRIVDSEVQKAGSLFNASIGVLNIIGLYSDSIIPVDNEALNKPDSLFSKDNFYITDDYRKWLEKPESVFDEYNL